MTTPLNSAERGCLLLADITGYTAYLQGTELEHAQDVLADLLETIIAQIEPPFVVSKLEGDAVFAYIGSTDIDASALLDTIEATYFAFRRRLRDVVHSTTCDCNACILIPSLDLKFFAHLGDYVVRRIGRNEELTGSDVVLVHRLLKGTAKDKIGNNAFAVLTAPLVGAMAVDVEALGLIEHTEEFDVGPVDVYVENLQERWQAAEAAAHDVVAKESAHTSLEGVFNASPQEVWSWFTDPRKRLQWQEGLTSIDEFVEGRRGVGTVNHCAHGPDVTIQQVVDWQPFTSFTSRDKVGDDGLTLTSTTVLTPEADGTHVVVYFFIEPEERRSDLLPNLQAAFGRNGDRLRAVLAGNPPAS
ncbi:MAG: DUF2652 domain-containing protein [Acidimicrobiia bacterium]